MGESYALFNALTEKLTEIGERSDGVIDGRNEFRVINTTRWWL